MGLAEYNRKRNFSITSEPPGHDQAAPSADAKRSFVIQKHAASHLHYDFRLELDGVLKSWSVPKGPSLDPKVKRLAMQTEDHPLAYADFEGIIPKGQYGGGTVLLWDRGTWEPQGTNPHKDFAAGNLKFYLKGSKLEGGFALVRIGGRSGRAGTGPGRDGDRDGRSWLLIKERDEAAREGDEADIPVLRPESVTTGRSIDEIAADRSRVWHSKLSQLDPSGEPGAERTSWPRRTDKGGGRRNTPPRLTAKKSPPNGAGWLHEIAPPGTRILAEIDGDEVRLRSETGGALSAAARRKLDWLPGAVHMLPAREAVLDGVIAPLGKREDQVGYFLFDLPYLDGYDLRRTPLERRKALLAELVRRIPEPGPIRYLDHIAGAGADFYREACRLGIPAMMSRRAESLYDGRAGWVKVACDDTPRSKARAPKTGTETSHAKTTKTTKTTKTAKTAARPAPRHATKSASATAAVTLTHPDRVLWPEVDGANGPGFTKADLARYYEAVADFMLPHVTGRPLTLVRCPDGLPAKPPPDGRPPGCFYMKHSGVWAPRALDRIQIQEKTKIGDYLVVRDIEGVRALVQMSILEIHLWGSLAERLEHPDRVVLDLDPDPAVPWTAVVETAFELRRRLERLGLAALVKTTGGKGLHVVVPFATDRSPDSASAAGGWNDALAFSRGIAERLERERPKQFITKMSKAERTGKIFIDYLRNQRGNTAIAAYSTRTRPGAPVAVPLAWEELTPRLDPRTFTVITVPARLAKLKRDPWSEALDPKQRLTPSLVQQAAG